MRASRRRHTRFVVFSAVMGSLERAFIPCWNFSSMMVGTLSARSSPSTSAELMPDMCPVTVDGKNAYEWHVPQKSMIYIGG